jgi:uncharacterized membrane protein YfcA
MTADPKLLLRDAAVGVGVGAFSGLLGVGGGILLVPFLVLAMAWGQKRAQATALVMVAMAGASGAVTYAIGDSVAWIPALIIMVGGLIGSLIGAVIVQRTADARLQILFGALLILVALRLLWPAGIAETDALPALTAPTVIGYLASGLGMGILSALFGIGGGILLIPLLITFFGFSQQLAAGTSLAVIVPISLLGALRLTKPGLTDWRIGFRFGLGAVIGAVIGASAALVIPGIALRIGFAVVLLLVALRMVLIGLRARHVHGVEGPERDSPDMEG